MVAEQQPLPLTPSKLWHCKRMIDYLPKFLIQKIKVINRPAHPANCNIHTIILDCHPTNCLSCNLLLPLIGRNWAFKLERKSQLGLIPICVSVKGRVTPCCTMLYHCCTIVVWLITFACTIVVVPLLYHYGMADNVCLYHCCCTIVVPLLYHCGMADNVCLY